MDIKKKYLQLIAEIEKYDLHYYQNSAPLISDYEYDQLFSKLKKMEEAQPEIVEPHSPTQRVSDAPLDAFEKLKHRVPMLSLQNTYKEEEILEFYEKTQRALSTEEDIELFCEPKFDGLAIELVYEKGIFTKALTRGDGKVGENVFSNIKTIKNIPLKIEGAPDYLEVRGEVLILKKDFLKLNQEQDEKGENVFANARNAAAGSIRQLDARVAASRPLQFFAYALGEVSDSQFASSQSEILENLKRLNIPTALEHQVYTKASNISEAIKYYQEIQEKRTSLDFDIDGIVIKINSLRLQEELGFIARNPRWAAAAKFKPEQEETVLEKIDLQVGRTGVVTPVARLTKVFVGGVSISQATLHNFQEVARKDLREGDTVLVHRAGDVIPEVIGPIKEKRSESSRAYKAPKHCPACNSELHQEEGEVALRCLNINCPATLKESLQHFVSRKAMNIDKLGERIIERFFELNIIQSFSDIYKLEKEELLKLERFGEKSVDNLMESIEKSKKRPLENVIFALGIRFVGEKTAETLAEHYGSLENFIKADQDELIELQDIGTKVSHSLIEQFKDQNFIREILELVKCGINPKKEKMEIKESSLKGKRFVITGSFEQSRDQIKKRLKAYGVQVQSSVSKNTDYLLAGEKAGSKMKKAQELGIKTISWAELEEII